MATNTTAADRAAKTRNLNSPSRVGTRCCASVEPVQLPLLRPHYQRQIPRGAAHFPIWKGKDMNSERIDVHSMKRRKKTAVPTRLIEAMLDIALLAGFISAMGVLVRLAF
jgi:hypothetical protein